MNDETAVLPVVPASPEPVEDDLARELAKAAPRRWWNRGTVVLAGAVLLVGGFAGGTQAQKSWGPAPSAAGGARGGARGFDGQNRAGGYFGGGAAAGAQRGAQGGAQGGTPGGAPATTAGATTGTVKLVDGRTIYVQTPDGDVVTVKTDAKTTVATASKGKLADVKAGQSVTVQGAAGTDGTVTATSVTAQRK
jgi:hypothetical protein